MIAPANTIEISELSDLLNKANGNEGLSEQDHRIIETEIRRLQQNGLDKLTPRQIEVVLGIGAAVQRDLAKEQGRIAVNDARISFVQNQIDDAEVKAA